MGSLRWRRNRHWVALVLLVGVGLLVVAGNWRISAFTSSEQSSIRSERTTNIAGSVELLDDALMHRVEVQFDPAEYDALIRDYQEDGEKTYIGATVTIDGTVVRQAAVRLKGNSTLMSLRRDSPFGGGREGRGPMRPPSECVPDEFREIMGGGTPAATPQAGATPAAVAIAAPGPGGPFGGNVSAEDPASLPWLISFDENVEGRRFQGQSEIAVRPVLGTKTMLNESLALSLVGAAGEPTQRSSYASFSVNGSEPSLRLVLESPGDEFVDRGFGGDGALYKALSTGSFDYLGDDPTLYETSFSQVTSRNHLDLKPVIDLVKWVNEASDAEFAAGLADRVDVGSLARYIALQELLDNFDDMAGPGKNYYLWYDLGSRRFTVLNWDMNLALSDMGGGPGGGRGPGGMDSAAVEEFRACLDRVRAAEGDDGADGARRGGGDPGGMRMGHPLKERFLAAPEFKALYAEQYAAVYGALYGSGFAERELGRLSGIVTSTGLVDATTIENDVSLLRTRLEDIAAEGPVPTVETATPEVGREDLATPRATPVAR